MIGEPVWFAKPELRRRYLARMAVFGIAALGAGAFFGSLVGAFGAAVGPLAGPWGTVALALVAGFGMARELFARNVPVPELKWQVPRVWVRSFWGGGIAFGAGMGMGVFTRQPSALFHLYVIGCFASASAAIGTIFGAVYGAVYFFAFSYGTFAWRASGPDGQQAGALSLGSRMRILGALAAPLLVTLPGAAPG